MKHLILIILSFGSCLINFNSQAQNDHSESPYFFVQGDRNTDHFPLLETDVDVNIAGIIANVKVTQVYKNEGKNPIEAIYLFPASTNAAIYGLQMKIGERIITAKIEEKQKAGKDYEQAKSEGKSTTLLEQHRPNVFQMNVANILPNDIIEVELLYTELLVPENGEYQFVYPTVIGPRYAQDPQKNLDNNVSYSSNPYLTEGAAPTYNFNIDVTINAPMPIQSISSTSHKVNINYTSAEQAIIQIDSKKEGNKDFIINYSLKDKKINDGILLYEGEKENFFLMMMQPPNRIETNEIVSREYIFVIDVSGSMNGYPIDVSKKLLRNLIGNLQPHEKFNVLLFAGGSNWLAKQSIPATTQNIDKAINVIDNQKGGGSTNLLSALQKSLSVPKDENFSRSYIIVTDGYVAVEHEAFELINDNLGDANFFAFGIGSSVNRHIIEGIAHAGMGEAFIVTKQGEAEEKAEKLRQYIQSPLLTNIKLTFSNIDTYDVIPQHIPDLMAERPIIVFGKYKNNPNLRSSIVKVNGVLANGHKYVSRLAFVDANCSDKNEALKNLWARHKIKQLSDYVGVTANETNKTEITNLGLQYNLMTQFTSFIAIDNQVRNEKGEITTVKQPLPLPEGVSNYAVNSGSLMQVKSKQAYAFSPPPSIEVVEDEVIVNEYKVPLIDADKGSKKPEKGIFTIVEKMPEFKGGDKEMLKYIYNNTNFEKTSCSIEFLNSKIIYEFIVNEDGSISNVKVLKSSGCEEIDDAYLKTLQNMPKWTPGIIGGKPVKTSFKIPINIHIE